MEAQMLIHILQTQLSAALREREAYPDVANRVPVDLGHPHVGLRDALGGVLAGEGGQLLLSLRANKLVSISKAGTATALPEKLIDIWLHALAAAAMGQSLRCVVVGRNAVVRVAPQDPQAARAQLQVLLAT